MKKRKTKRKGRSAPFIQFGTPRDTVKVLATLDARLEQSILMGRDVVGQEIAREIGKLGGVHGVNITNSTFNG